MEIENKRVLFLDVLPIYPELLEIGEKVRILTESDCGALLMKVTKRIKFDLILVGHKNDGLRRAGEISYSPRLKTYVVFDYGFLENDRRAYANLGYHTHQLVSRDTIKKQIRTLLGLNSE